MKELILLRHAAAERQRPGTPDFDRPLTDQGRTEALDAADCLKRSGVRLDALLASPALRARETALIVAAHLDFNRALHFDEQLYHGELESLLQPLQRCDAQAESVLMVGHNPGLSALARQLAGDLPVRREGVARGRTELPAGAARPPLDLTTAGICRLQFEAPAWTALEPGAIAAVSLLR